MSKSRLTPTQRRVLEVLAAGGKLTLMEWMLDSWFCLQTAHGIQIRAPVKTTVRCLRAAGLITVDYDLTEQGRAALQPEGEPSP